MQYAITTTALEVVKPASVPRRFLFSAGLFSTAVYVALRSGTVGTNEVLLSVNGTTALPLDVPPGTSIFALTDAGTAQLAVTKLRGG